MQWPRTPVGAPGQPWLTKALHLAGLPQPQEQRKCQPIHIRVLGRGCPAGRPTAGTSGQESEPEVPRPLWGLTGSTTSNDLHDASSFQWLESPPHEGLGQWSSSSHDSATAQGRKLRHRVDRRLAPSHRVSLVRPRCESGLWLLEGAPSSTWPGPPREPSLLPSSTSTRERACGCGYRASQTLSFPTGQPDLGLALVCPSGT